MDIKPQIKTFLVETEEQFQAALIKKQPCDIIIALSEKPILEDIDQNQNCHYYDDKACPHKLKDFIKKIDHFLWNWFLDTKGCDYSQSDGASVGLVFLPSIHYLYTAYIRYFLSFERFLTKECQEIMTFSSVHPTALVAAKAYCKIHNKSLHIQEQGSFIIEKDEKYQIKLDYQGRKRDLENVFRPIRFIEKVLSLLSSVFIKKYNFNTLLTSGNKVLDLLDYTHGQDTNYFLKPISKRDFIKSIFARRFGYTDLNYSILSKSRTSSEKIQNIKSIYKEKYHDSTLELYFLEILDKEIFHYVSRADEKYFQYLDFLSRMSLKKALFTADSHEGNILLALASKKQGITNILTPHGLYGYGYHPFKSGRFKLFDKYIAFGKKDLIDYQSADVKDEDIYITPLPHFARFKKTKRKPRKNLKAIILPMEYSNIALGSSIRHQKKFIKETVLILKELGIEILGVKSRGHYALAPIQDELDTIEGLNILDPNISLQDYFEQADIVIGTSGSALIEANLSGLKYYCCHTKNETIPSPFAYLCILDFYHSAHSAEELRENINLDRRFKGQHNIQDIISLEAGYDFASCAKQYIQTLKDIDPL